jgi:nucleoside-diphosphate-sugar epimerase
MSGMQVVVTGGGGFIGSRLALALARAGHAVTACYRNRLAPGLRGAAGITLLRGDLSEGLVLPDRFDVLVHCASEIPGLCPDPAHLTQSNLGAMAHVCRSVCRAGARTVINLSSISAYGRINVPEVEELLPSNDPDPYGLTKLRGEEALAALAEAESGLSGLSIRLPGVVGRGSHHNFLSTVIARIVARQPVQAVNPEALFNNIVYVEDLARFVAGWLAAPVPGHVITNIAACDPLPIRTVIELLYEGIGRRPDVTFRTGGKSPFLISLDRVRSLGYQPSTVAESLRAFADDVLSDAEVRHKLAARG